MKRALIKLTVFLVVLGLLGGTAWYFLVHNPARTAGYLVTLGENAAGGEDYDTAIGWYRLANRLQPQDQDIALCLADAYRAMGNYTKAEYTLSHAIAAGGTAEVYLKLCQVYVEQDKLLDAVTMLDQIADPTIKAQLDAQRPAAPTADLEPGFYSQYMTVHVTAASGSLYVSTNHDYPSTKASYTTAMELPLGETSVKALAVADNGLVSPLAVFGYTISGVVEEVQLQDDVLEAHVQELLHRDPGSTLTTADLWSITELTVPDDASNLSDLSYFTGLKRLTILDKDGVDLSFLASTTALEYLDLTGSSFDAAHLPVIGGLHNLKTLNLSDCGLSTLAGLEGLTALTTLDLSNNIVSDLSPLANAAGLTTLNLSGNAVVRFPLEGLAELSWLDLSNNALTDFSSIAACIGLQYLDVSNNSLTALTGLGQLTALTTLDASSNALTDTTGIGSCVSLTTLNLSNNKLTTMDELAGLTGVVNMDVSYNDILTIPDFPDDAALVKFNGCHNYFEDVSGLAGIQGLNYVYLDYNNITDINVLASCPLLIQVNVFRTNVTDVSALQEMSVIVSYNPT